MAYEGKEVEEGDVESEDEDEEPRRDEEEVVAFGKVDADALSNEEEPPFPFRESKVSRNTR